MFRLTFSRDGEHRIDDLHVLTQEVSRSAMFSLCKEAKPPQVPLFGFANSTPVPLWSRAAQAHGSHGSHGSHGCGYRGVSPCRRPSRRSACRVPQMTWFEQAAHKIGKF